jgi:hypothetical protein
VLDEKAINFVNLINTFLLEQQTNASDTEMLK